MKKSKIPPVTFHEFLDNYRELAVKYEEGTVNYDTFHLSFSFVVGVPYRFFKPDTDDFKYIQKEIDQVKSAVEEIREEREKALHNPSNSQLGQ